MKQQQQQQGKYLARPRLAPPLPAGTAVLGRWREVHLHKRAWLAAFPRQSRGPAGDPDPEQEMGACSRLSPRSAPPGLSRALSLAPAVVAKLSPPKVQPFEAIPRNGHNPWLNLFHFWRTNAFQNFHRVMDRNFQNLGPIYR